MPRQTVSLVLVASLLAWASGLLLGIHVHEAGEEHDAEHCETCLVLHTGGKAVVEIPPPALGSQLVSWPAPQAPATVIPARFAHSAVSPRAPPLA